MRAGLIAGTSALALLGCMSNFDMFIPDAGAPVDASTDGAVDASTDAGVGCNPACTGTAKTCAGNCRDAGAQCVAMCGSNQCRNACNQTRDNCIGKCRTDCTACTMDAGCAGACQNATN